MFVVLCYTDFSQIWIVFSLHMLPGFSSIYYFKLRSHFIDFTHRFPNDTLLLKKWLIAMRREKWIPSKSSKICSRHFTDDSYETSPWATQRRLKPNAVPSIFNFPEHLQKPNKSRPSPRKRTHESTTSNESIETAAM